MEWDIIEKGGSTSSADIKIMMKIRKVLLSDLWTQVDMAYRNIK